MQVCYWSLSRREHNKRDLHHRTCCFLWLFRPKLHICVKASVGQTGLMDSHVILFFEVSTSCMIARFIMKRKGIIFFLYSPYLLQYQQAISGYRKHRSLHICLKVTVKSLLEKLLRTFHFWDVRYHCCEFACDFAEVKETPHGIISKILLVDSQVSECVLISADTFFACWLQMCVIIGCTGYIHVSWKQFPVSSNIIFNVNMLCSFK